MVKTSGMRPFQLLIILGFLASGLPQAQALNSSQCVNIFVRAESQEILLTQMASFEALLVERLAHETNPALQTVYSGRLSDLQELITDVLNLSIKDGVQLVEMDRRYEDIVRAVDRNVRLAEKLSAPPKIQSSGNLFQVEVTHQAQKDFLDLQKYLQDKYTEFLNEAQSISDIHQLSPHWHVEKLTDRRIDNNPVHSAQLNHGYRVVFTLGQAHTLIIHNISKTVTHGGH